MSVTHGSKAARDGEPNPPVEEKIRDVAAVTLNHIARTAERAEASLATARPNAATVFAANNSFNSSADENLAGILDQDGRSLRELAREPAIARIVVEDGKGEERTIYITRTTPLPRRPGDPSSASYLSPMGRLAALPVGRSADVKSPDGVRSFEVVERAMLKPVRETGEWDAVDTVFEDLGAGLVTIRSLRAALRPADAEVDDDYLAQLVAGDPSSVNIVDGLKRSVIDKMALRERSVLDEYQDDIFRLPLDTRLALLGPPGTGKTTTLIKRLRQKVDVKFLEEDERRQVAETAAGLERHSGSWLMFTPTDLLKRYVVEALGREDVAASDRTVTTWDDHRMDLARNRQGCSGAPIRAALNIARRHRTSCPRRSQAKPSGSTTSRLGRRRTSGRRSNARQPFWPKPPTGALMRSAAAWARWFRAVASASVPLP